MYDKADEDAKNYIKIFTLKSEEEISKLNNIFDVSSVDRTNITGLSYETGLLFNTEISKDKYVAFALSFQKLRFNFCKWNIIML